MHWGSFSIGLTVGFVLALALSFGGLWVFARGMSDE
jgi:hypothetical protein